MIKKHHMKTITTLFIVAILSLNVQAQIRAGRYNIYYAENQLVLQQKIGYDPLLIIDNKPTTGTYGVWDVKQVIGKPNCFFIQNVASKKCITWSTPAGGDPHSVNISVHLETQLPIRNMPSQTFRFENIKDGYYNIMPDNGETTGSNIFGLGTVSANGPNSIIGCINMTGIDAKNYTWIVEKVSQVNVSQPITILTQRPQIISRNDNKIEFDFKTGGDNLEPKSFQKNVQLTINIKNHAPIVVDDVNNNQSWPNNSIRRVAVPIPSDINMMDVESATLTRTVVNGWNNVDAGGADNWNLDKLTATALVKREGRVIRTVLYNQSGSPLFRFIYEKRNNTNASEGLTKTFIFSLGGYGTATVPTSTPGLAAITAVFGTGGDNLEGGNGNNVNITIKYKSKPQVTVINNINDRANWGNFTENSVTKTIPNSTTLDINDIKEIELRHTGGGGFAADNWHLDKFKLTITKGGETKVLVDKVGAPIHIFTGDSRRKLFVVE